MGKRRIERGKPKILLGAILLFLAFPLTGCMEEKEEKAYRVAAVMPQDSRSFPGDVWWDLWECIEKECKENGLALSSYTAGSSARKVAERLQLVKYAQVDGVILYSYLHQSYMRKTLQEAGIKVVLVGTKLEEGYYDAFVRYDPADTGKRMYEYLKPHLADGNILLLVEREEGKNHRQDAFLDCLESDGYGQIWWEEPDTVPLALGEEGAGMAAKETVGGAASPSIYLVPREVAAHPEWMKEILIRAKIRWVVTFDSMATQSVCEGEERYEGREELLCYSHTEDAVKYARDGVIQALFTVDEDLIGQRAVEVMAALLEGEELPQRDIWIEEGLWEGDSMGGRDAGNGFSD